MALWAHPADRVLRGHLEEGLCPADPHLGDRHRVGLAVALQGDLSEDRRQVPLHRGDRGEGHQEDL